MDQLTKTIQTYEALSKNKYQILIEDGTVINLRFKKENYHHLAGFQHLTDFRDISNPRQGKKQFYQDIREQRIKMGQDPQKRKIRPHREAAGVL